MLYPPKPLGPAQRRPARLYEIEFALHRVASSPGSQATLEAMDHPAHPSSVVTLSLDAQIARAIEAASGWVIERYVSRR